MMRIFFDTEFTGLHQTTTLISIGCVAENGRTFYAEMTDYSRSQVDVWVAQNVIAGLYLPPPSEGEIVGWAYSPSPKNMVARGPSVEIAPLLSKWLMAFNETVEMWSDCLAYDWVLFCQLFGGAMDIPRCIYYIPLDLATLLKASGIDPDVSREQFSGLTNSAHKHNALWDAQVIKACYDKIEAAE